jgi:hypothetical protein
MAHFAKIEDGTVTEVVVVDNEHETYGEQYLNDLGLTGTWVQTSYNANFRAKFAGIGDIYDAEEDVFKPAKPFDSWVWDADQWNWLPPVARPGIPYEWDEANQEWVALSE